MKDSNGYYQIIHHYSLSTLLHRSKYSEIYKAIDIKTQENYAIKCISKQKLNQSRYCNRVIFNETITSQLLSHPNILSALEVLDSSSTIYQVTNYCEHGDLLHFLRKKVLNFQMSLKVISQLLEAVEFLHSFGICHRDIKLDNILLDKGGKVYLSDFSMSSITFNRIIRSGIGCFDYLAPEAIKEHEFNGFKADMWSLGVVFYAIYTRKFPYRNPNPNFDFKQDVDYSRVPEEIRNFIQSLLSINPNDRPSATECLRNPIFNNFPRVEKLPLSSIENHNFSQVDLNSFIIGLSRALGMSLTNLKAKLECDKMNQEKLMLLLHKCNIYREAKENKDRGFFKLPSLEKGAYLKKTEIFSYRSDRLYSLFYESVLSNDLLISSSLSPRTFIFIPSSKDVLKITFSIDTLNEDKNKCCLTLYGETKFNDVMDKIISDLNKKKNV